MYLFGVLFIKNLYVHSIFFGLLLGLLLAQVLSILLIWSTSSRPPSILVFIFTLLLLSADFYFLKNIAGRRLVGLRWWNEVNTSNGESHWVFETSDMETRTITATDKRFFWLSLYLAPALWVALAILAIIQLESPIWLSLVGK